MLRERYPYILAGRPVQANEDLEVRNKYSGEVATRVALAGKEAVEEAIAAAAAAAGAMRELPSHERKRILLSCAGEIESRREEMAQVLAVEAGKAIQHARIEVTRCLDTFRIAAEEAVRGYGEYQPLDISPYADGYEGIWKRVPIGPCSFIVPFNFPLNLGAHKIAPGIAAGCPFVVKPATYTPVSLLIVGDILARAGLPEGAFSVLPCSRDAAGAFTTDERFKLLSFTGSPDVGWDLKARAGKKKVVLELGGNAACIVDRDADLEEAARRIVYGAFYQAGQSCISVQRILLHEEIYGRMKERLVAATAELKAGDPLDEETFLSPLITEKDARRVEEWVEEAASGGARVLAGGKRDGVMFDATLLENADPSARVSCREVFGPVAVLQAFTSFDDAIRDVNNSDFGLQAGVFTRDIHHAFRAFNEIEAGGIVINDIPSMRVDSMPYGGIKDSGLGREGVRFAIEDMTEIRLMVLHRIGRG